MADLADMEARLRRRWELNRLVRSALRAMPLLVLGMLGAWLAQLGTLACCCALLLPVGAAVALQRGGALGRSVLPGVVLGAVPLLAGIGARAWDGVHCCGGGCSATCLPACVTAGVIAGFWAVRLLRQSDPRSAPAALPLLGFVAVTGALGCSCVGHAGALGMALGLLTAASPLLVLRPRTS